MNIIPKPICVRIRDPKLWKDFQDFVISKYGVKHTVMALEFEKAVFKHLADEGWKDYSSRLGIYDDASSLGVHTHKKISPKKGMFLKAFYKKFFYDSHITYPVLIDFIRTELEIKDKRAVRGWVSFMRAFGLIKQVTPEKWEITFTATKYAELGLELKEDIG